MSAFIIENFSYIVLALLIFIILIGVVVLNLVLSQSKRSINSATIQQLLEQQSSQLREFQIEKFGESALRFEKEFHSMKDTLTQAQNELKERVITSISGLNQSLLQQQSEFQKLISEKISKLHQEVSQDVLKGQSQQQSTLSLFKEDLLGNLQRTQQLNQQAQLDLRDKLIEELRQTVRLMREEITNTLTNNSKDMVERMNNLTQSTDERLKSISGQVEKRLNEGFEKTTQTFNDVLKRLALIDDAQKKITELSSNVVSLQQVLADKRSRGAFGEVQLNSLVQNVLPESHYQIQATLSNGKIADCLLKLPEPTGHLAIDAKFPLESYQKMTDFERSELERQSAAKQFKQDVKKHINDIAEKYIIQNETASGAMMFIPAEAIFAEIHGHFPELVELAHKAKVWMVSPTTMMAILTTASAVIKDEATRKQVHIIQEHLGALSEDFGRFKTRMDNLSKHIGQVSKDVKEIHTSADKITKRFVKIEKVELLEADDKPQVAHQVES